MCRKKRDMCHSHIWYQSYVSQSVWVSTVSCKGIEEMRREVVFEHFVLKETVVYFFCCLDFYCQKEMAWNTNLSLFYLHAGCTTKRMCFCSCQSEHTSKLRFSLTPQRLWYHNKFSIYFQMFLSHNAHPSFIQQIGSLWNWGE